MIYIFLAAAISSWVLGKIMIPVLLKRKIRQSEREEGPESHLKKVGTPTMGGVFIIMAIILTYILAWLFKVPQFIDNIGSITILFVFSLAFALIGFIDDYFKVEKKTTDGLSPKSKMLLLILISFVFVIIEFLVLKNPTIIMIPFLEIKLSVNLIVYIILSILVMLSTPNALNLTDGVDGLASSVGIAILFYFLVASILDQKYDIAVFLLTIIGAYSGFLIHNWHKAKVFMGDTGSFFLGGVIGLVAIALGKPLYLIFIAIIPLMETVSVILQVWYFKKTGGKRIFKMTPYHHHLELSGWKEVTIVLFFTAITLVSGLILMLFKIC